MRQIQDLSLGFHNLHDGNSRCRQRSTTHRREQRDPHLWHRLPQFTRLSLCPGRNASIDGSAYGDHRFNRAYPDASRYASEDIIGVKDLANDGRWEQMPEYGYAWTPTAVAVGWVPFSAGRWFWQDPALDLDQQRSLEVGGLRLTMAAGCPIVRAVLGSSAPQNTRSKIRAAVVQFVVCVRDHRLVSITSLTIVSFLGGNGHCWLVTQNITYVNRTYGTVVNQKILSLRGRSITTSCATRPSCAK